MNDCYTYNISDKTLVRKENMNKARCVHGL